MNNLHLFVAAGAAALAVFSPAQGSAPLNAPVARLGGPLPIEPVPYVNTTIINNDGVAAHGSIALIRQCELRSLDRGLYRVAATVSFTLSPSTSSLITGTLDLSSAVPRWTPNQDVAVFNTDHTEGFPDEYALSISQDGLSAVWDNNVGAQYPGVNTQDWHTFCCHRPTTTVPFRISDIKRVVGINPNAIFVDPHIGEESPNGVVELFHNDFVPRICRGSLDTTTGILGPTTPVTTHVGAAFDHSSSVHRDSTGKARAVNWSRYPGSGGSSAFYSEGISDDGTPELVIDGAVPVARWYNNPGLVGGSWHYCSDGQTEPQLREVTMIANTSIVGGSGRIPAWAPIRPQQRGSGVFISVVAIGVNVGTVPVSPYPVPLVTNHLFVLPLFILDMRSHDPFNGLAEWAFDNVPSLNLTYDMQLLTLDVLGSQVIASNTATLTL